VASLCAGSGSDIFIEKADQQALRSACENIIRNAIRSPHQALMWRWFLSRDPG